MKRILTFLFIIGLATLIGGLYGILHDQLTYTISPEYYSKFKFIQFGFIDPSEGEVIYMPKPRIYVAMVGFFATWWMGLLIGLILSVVGLTHKDNKRMLVTTLGAINVTIIVTFVTGLIGLAYGKFHLVETGVSWWLPDNLIDKKNFIAVGSMHNFSYLGGLIGLIIGTIYILRQKGRYITTDTNKENNGSP